MVKPRTAMAKKYHPLADPKYMSIDMKSFFRNKLKRQLNALNRKCLAFGKTLQVTAIKEPDFVDQSCSSEERFNHFAYYSHERRQLHEIEMALQRLYKRLYNGNYGYCLATGEPIGVNRLLAEPCAKYSLEQQISRENLKYFHG
jgi:DnaK suppressor protein